MTGEDAVLQLQLSCEEAWADVFEMSHTGEWHLLFDDVAEGFAADGIVEGHRQGV